MFSGCDFKREELDLILYIVTVIFYFTEPRFASDTFDEGIKSVGDFIDLIVSHTQVYTDHFNNAIKEWKCADFSNTSFICF